MRIYLWATIAVVIVMVLLIMQMDKVNSAKRKQHTDCLALGGVSVVLYRKHDILCLNKSAVIKVKP